MKSRGNQLKRTEVSYLSLFCATMAVSGIGILLLGKKAVLYSQVLELNGAMVANLQGGSKFELLAYVMRERWWPVPLLFLVSTTYLGKITGYLMTAWYGVGAGTILGVALLRYGLTGIVFMLGAFFPHYLLYVSAFVMSLKLNRGQRVRNRKFLLQFLMMEGLVLLGCLAEAYFSPILLEKILPLF